MKVELGNDGIWSASGNGNLRPIAAFGDTRNDAMKRYGEVFFDQQSEEYEYEQSMGHLADISEPNWTPQSGHNYGH